MAFKLKNIRPGVLIIADAAIRLEPGQTINVDSLSPQLEQALSGGQLARLETKEPKPAPVEEDDKPVTKPTGTKKQRTVIDSLKNKLEDVPKEEKTKK